MSPSFSTTDKKSSFDHDRDGALTRQSRIDLVILWLTCLAVFAGVGCSGQLGEGPNDGVEPSLATRGGLEKEESSQPLELVSQSISYPFEQFDRVPEGYVGTKVCKSCHEERHETYQRTHHSRSLSKVDPQNELHDDPSQALQHLISRRSYDVNRRDNLLWHKEWGNFGDDKLELGELPVCYVMGSGAFAKAYALVDGDYLLQSPVTWYSLVEEYGMAPGYDQPNHFGLTRVMSDKCIYCHAGLVSFPNQTSQKRMIHELAIGCERCHGPGKAHTDLYRELADGDLSDSSKPNDTKIVNPSDLSREQAESICAQCHLAGDIIVQAPGSQAWDFQPGQLLAENRLHYKTDQLGDLSDVFSGHFDQMWQSACYLNSETLTCITCHDSHPEGAVEDRVSMRREQCKVCHQPNQGCGLPLEQRLEKAEDNCIECHMPSLETKVPHASTTSHLVAVYENGRPRDIDSDLQSPLRRLERSAGLNGELVERSDLLAETYWVLKQASQGNRDSLQPKALEERLKGQWRGDRSDAEIHSLLARINREFAESITDHSSIAKASWDAAAKHARKALALEPSAVESRVGALEALGNQAMEANDYEEAIRCFVELGRTRRQAVDWYNLGLCLGRVSRFGDAEQAFREAIRIDGDYAAPYRSLSRLYRTIDPQLSRQFSVIASQLTKE